MIGLGPMGWWEKTLPKCVDYEEITVDNSVVQITPSKLAACHEVFVRIRNGPVMLVPTGTPTPSFGWLMLDSDNFRAGRLEAQDMRATRFGASNGLLQVGYYKYV
jgi:hypothetical protein